MRNFLALPVLLSLAAACSASPHGDRTELGQAKSAIIGGKASTAEQDAVVLLIHTDRQTSFASCTGTLIAPNLVLTARHCVANVADQPFGCDVDGKPQGGGGVPGSTLRANEFYVFKGAQRPRFGGNTKADGRGAKVFHDNAKTLCGHDLALVLLQEDVADAPIMPLRLEELPTAGESMTAVGWGVTDSSPYPSKRMQRTGIKVDKVGPFKGSGFEAPVPLNDFRIGEAICSGDSGGPGIAESGAIIGVVSRGGNGNFDEQNPAAGCKGSGTQNEYTSVAPFKDVILEAFAESGHEPWLEGQPDPRLAKFSDPCESAEACRSGVCVAGACTQSCTANTDCPSGFECAANGNSTVCKAPAAAAANSSSSSGGCVAGAAGPVGPVVPWLLAAGLGLLSRRRRRA